MLDVFLARQPIFDRASRLAGYELLYRSNGVDNHAVGVSQGAMATNTVVHAVLDLGLADVTGGAIGYINVTRDVLLSGMIDLLDPRAVVLELVEDTDPDAEILAACHRLRSAGYELALDDYVGSPDLEPLLRLATMVKVDVLGRSVDELSGIAHRLRAVGVRMLAEKVETADVYVACRELGFELFQGYHFGHPEMISGRSLAPNVVSVVRLLNLLRDPSATDVGIEDAFRGDPGLSFKLLRLVTSAAFGARGVRSIQHAVRLLGRGMLYKWTTVLFVAELGRGSGVDQELAKAALVRARLCELLAEASGASGPPLDPGALFTVGLFSMLGALLRLPMDEVLVKLELAPELTDALLRRTGHYAPALTLVEHYERGSFDAVPAAAAAAGVRLADLVGLYASSLAWAHARIASLSQ